MLLSIFLGQLYLNHLLILLKVKFIPPFLCHLGWVHEVCYRLSDNGLQFKTEMLDINDNMPVITVRENKFLTDFCILMLSDIYENFFK